VEQEQITVSTVLIAAIITAIATGLGALPFLFVRNVSKQWLGLGNSLAAGLMLGASLGLIYEGVQRNPVGVVIGMALGLVLVVASHRLLESRGADFQIGNIKGTDAIQMLMIVGVMTVHSFAEGVGVGVSYGDGSAFGTLISLAIAIHNIPEGLAISLVLIPRGTSVWKAAGWSIFSSLPQPIMAVPAFLFVLTFQPFLPVGLGLAAGAMIWMVFSELLPEALEEMPPRVVYATMIIAVIAMLSFQIIMGD
jgi:zinc transporter, ZIP family